MKNSIVDKIKEKINIHRKQVKTLGKTITDLHQRACWLEEKELKKKLTNNFNTDIKYLINTDEYSDSFKQRELERLLNGTAIGIAGIYFKNHQFAFQIMLNKNAPMNVLKKTTTIMYTIMRYMKKENTSKIFGIFEHTLSEDGVYKLEIIEKSYVITRTRYQHREIISKHETLLSALKRIACEFYYKED